MQVFLTGMPGSGKSTLGRALSDLLKLRFFDLDNLITSLEGSGIPKIIAEQGEDYFRRTEQRALHHLLTNESNYLLACGGGTPCFFDNQDRMLARGLVVFLDVPLNTITERLQLAGTSGRPLLGGTKSLELKIKELYENRLHCYLRANRVYRGNSAEELAKLISGQSNCSGKY